MSDTADRRIVLVRHAETEWSLAGRHTGRTDLPLTDGGRKKARQMAERLAGRRFATVLTSPLARARQTCEIAGYGDVAEVRGELTEWDYGDYEGLTTAEIREARPGWILWNDGVPGGESPEDVSRRVDGVVEELSGEHQGGDVAVFAHGHSLRALAVRWIGLPIDAGRLLVLGTGTLSTLGWKREIRVIDEWNSSVSPPEGQVR